MDRIEKYPCSNCGVNTSGKIEVRYSHKDPNKIEEIEVKAECCGRKTTIIKDSYHYKKYLKQLSGEAVEAWYG